MRSSLHKTFVVFIMFLSSTQLYAASFTATVSSQKVSLGQSIILRLTLTDARATESPDLTVLFKDFNIQGHNQFSSYSIVNGQVNAESGWDISLLPKKSGELSIPSLQVKTNKGVISTDKIEIKVDGAQSKGKMDSAGISLASTISKNTTYVQEPVVYTLKIISYQPWANIALFDIKSSDAIIEKASDPKQYDQNYGGMWAHIIEVKYYITPLVEGDIKITAPSVHGEVQNKTGMYQGLFDYQPFSIQGDEISIKALPPAIPGKDWLPLQDLVLSEEWDVSEPVKEGDTISRKIKMVARGAFSSQLPDLREYQDNKNLKIYANKPEYNDEIKQDVIIGTKQEEYDFVPREPGTINLPEIKVKWWNLRTNKEVISVLPAKTIEVKAIANNNRLDNEIIDYGDSAEHEWWLYIFGLIASIGLSIACTTLWLKRPRQSKSLHHVEPTDLASLRQYIIQYAQRRWGLAGSVDIYNLCVNLEKKGYAFNVVAYCELEKMLNEGLYAKSNKDFSSVMQAWVDFRKSVSKPVKLRKKPAVRTPTTINPT